jgi:oxalate decarboxylase/phosphoglucose isomerase-like protein (cupin superfamily)
MIDKILKRQLKNKNNNAEQTPDVPVQPKYVPIEYGHRLHNLLKKELKPFNITPAPRMSNKIEQILKPKHSSAIKDKLR